MSDHYLTDDERLFRDEIFKFATTSVRAASEAMELNEAFDPQLAKQCFELGLMGIEVPEQLNGSGGSFFMACLAIEELSKVDPSVAVFVDVQNTLMNNVLLNWGTQEQKAKYLPLLTTSKVGSFCLTEADSGSDAFALRTKAVEKGDYWEISGKKVFITNAEEASLFLVFASKDLSQGYKGICAFIAEKEGGGITIGKKERKLGIRGSSTCEVIFDKVKVPKANVVGEIGKGYKIAIETLNEGRIGIGAQMIGVAQGAFQNALTYAKERIQFQNKLTQFQAIQFQFARLACDIEAARLMTYNAARLKDSGKDFTKEAAMTKYFSSNIAERVASETLEVYGGYGFVAEFPAEKYYRDVKIGKLYEGTSNMQLMTIYKCLEKENSFI